jgi:hypothetical protein
LSNNIIVSNQQPQIKKIIHAITLFKNVISRTYAPCHHPKAEFPGRVSTPPIPIDTAMYKMLAELTKISKYNAERTGLFFNLKGKQNGTETRC